MGGTDARLKSGVYRDKITGIICAVIADDCPCTPENKADIAVYRENLKALMERLVTEENCCMFISGMHRGIEQIGAEIALELKEKHGVKLWGILSSEHQWTDWSESERDRFFSLMERADYEFLVSRRESEKERAEQLKVIAEESDLLIVDQSELSPAVRAVMTRAIAAGKQVFTASSESPEFTPSLRLLT